MLDRRPTPEEQVMQLLEADTYRQLIDSLGERQRTIMKLTIARACLGRVDGQRREPQQQ